MAAVKTELEIEQSYVSMLYARLDTLRARAAERVAQALRPGEHGGTSQGRLERDALVSRHRDRLAKLRAAEGGLCFGRLDLADGSRRYVGRLGLADDDREPLLVDWRAPAAQPFYRATPANPGGVIRRRHLRTRGRKVVAIEDDVFDLDALSDHERSRLSGEASLLAALNSSRTGRMAEIVATIQAEQDRIIRSELPGMLVVAGGPGTGKTAVALHRAAYLLYTHRQRLARRGVLVIGPNPTFLRYIERVLPSLGETGVVLATTGELFPGVSATAEESPDAAAIKGDHRMVGVLAAAVRDHQRIPDEDLEIEFDGQTLLLDRATCERARRRARAAGTPHNLARPGFRRELLEALSRQVVARLVADLPEVELPDDDLINDDVPSERLLDAEREEIRAELGAAPRVRAAIDALWPRLRPAGLLAELLTSPRRLAAAAPQLRDAERARLLRSGPPPRGNGAGWWTAADVPLLDELAALLGEHNGGAGREALQTEQRRRELAYARGVLDMVGIDEDGIIDPTVLAARHFDGGRGGGLAELALHDRGWTFGHVIVDEAQEVSAMAWRMLLRRCPARSMTVAGDTAQRGAPGGVSSWADLLEPHAPGAWRVEQLTVNYRTPAEIIAVAADVLASISPELRPPRSVRETGVLPWALRLDEAELAARLPEIVAAEAAVIGDGKLAVLLPSRRAAELGGPIAATVGAPEPAWPGGDQRQDLLSAPVAVLTVTEAKGLEFDSVLVVDPAGVLDGSPRGASDLYVALTRATQRLGVVHSGQLPPLLGRLRQGSALSAPRS